jgi:hypothetical protein
MLPRIKLLFSNITRTKNKGNKKEEVGVMEKKRELRNKKAHCLQHRHIRLKKLCSVLDALFAEYLRGSGIIEVK